MTNITISDLHPTDFDLLSNSDSYMRELSDEELKALAGGFDVVSYFIGFAVGGIITFIWDFLIGNS